MKVKMIVSQYGPKISRNAGDVVEIENAEAKRMIEAGICEPVRGVTRENTSTKPRTEKAVK